MRASRVSSPIWRRPDVRSHEPRDVGQVFTLELQRLETCTLDRFERLPVRVAAAGDPTPRSLEPILPLRELRIRRPHVFEEHEASARSQHAADLLQHPRRIVDRTEHGEAHDRVERLVLEGQCFGRSFDKRDVTPELGRTAPRTPEHRLGRVDADELVDWRIVREAQAGADADLEDAPARVCEQLALELRAELLLGACAQAVVDGGKGAVAH